MAGGDSDIVTRSSMKWVADIAAKKGKVKELGFATGYDEEKLARNDDSTRFAYSIMTDYLERNPNATNADVFRICENAGIGESVQQTLQTRI
jgi:hypothetical protein